MTLLNFVPAPLPLVQRTASSPTLSYALASESVFSLLENDFNRRLPAGVSSVDWALRPRRALHWHDEPVSCRQSTPSHANVRGQRQRAGAPKTASSAAPRRAAIAFAVVLSSIGAQCDADDYCDGTNANCPVAYAPSSTVCRPLQAGCDVRLAAASRPSRRRKITVRRRQVVDYCPGNSNACSADAVQVCFG